MATPTTSVSLFCCSSSSSTSSASLFTPKIGHSAIALPPKREKFRFKIQANLGGSGERDAKKAAAAAAAKKKFITKEEEPEQYWQTAGEREGENPMKTPLPYIIIFGMSTPFIILAVAFANGWIKMPIR